MKLLKTLSIAAITALVLTRAAQVGSVINRPLDEIGVGEQVKLNGEQFVKVNNNGLLMMTSTYSCPHGKMIAGAWVACHYCDLAHGYFDYNNYTCACNSGWNYRTSDHACIACPQNSNWSTSAQVCQCSANYYMPGDNDTCLSCPANTSASVGSTTLADCTCNANYYGNSSDGCTNCPANSTSNANSTTFSDCKCNANYYMDNGSCATCPAGEVSAKGSTSASDCMDFNAITSLIDTTYCNNPIDFMHTWTGCDSLAENATVCLVDPRDYRAYQVRKLADGKCWMVNDLKFGGDYGDTDGCAVNNGEGNYTYSWCGSITKEYKNWDTEGQAYTECISECQSTCYRDDYYPKWVAYCGNIPESCSRGGSTNLTKAQEQFAPGYYGHCRYVGVIPHSFYADEITYLTYDTYLYDWVATMQSTLAYQDSSATFPGQQQGICPIGWHIPTGENGGDFYGLADAYQYDYYSFTDASKFNSDGTGHVDGGTGGLTSQYYLSDYWSSTGAYTYSSFALEMDNYYGYSVNITNYGQNGSLYKSYGLAVRCVKD